MAGKAFIGLSKATFQIVLASLDHEVLLNILGERIHDNRFLRLIRHMLQAGYLEEWRLA